AEGGIDPREERRLPFAIPGSRTNVLVPAEPFEPVPVVSSEAFAGEPLQTKHDVSTRVLRREEQCIHEGRQHRGISGPEDAFPRGATRPRIGREKSHEQVSRTRLLKSSGRDLSGGDRGCREREEAQETLHSRSGHRLRRYSGERTRSSESGSATT